MQDDRQARRQAAKHRNAARVRVQRVTGAVLAASVAVTGALAGYVSSATHSRKTATQTVPAATTTTKVAVPATPDPPTLIASASSLSQSSPSQAPVQTQAAPVAVSGGS